MSEMFLPRFMIAAPNSGSGKTTVVCALLKALFGFIYVRQGNNKVFAGKKCL